MRQRLADARLFLADRPRIEIRLTSGETKSLPTWLVVALPGPLDEDRPEGRVMAEPRLPECEIVFEWGQIGAAPLALDLLTVTVGEHSWVLEQDRRHPERWRRHHDPDERREWS